jgi:uncharacterized protein YcbK (DUF882 family)
MFRNMAILWAVALLPGCSETAPVNDSARFAEWQSRDTNRTDAKALQDYLDQNKVGNVLPLRQLLRSDTDWRWCGVEPFDVPPKPLWPHMVPTLKLIRDEVQPLVGSVEALSVFRGEAINTCIGGASQSQHMRFYAIDMRPLGGSTRKQLIEKLCALQARKGKALNMGLGIYKGTRFHIDTAGFRRWGHDHHAASSPCTSFVAPQRKSS